ncbi:DUF29 domain-containing protein [Tumidithrix helvetica PCC 7403]|uniref:DUF29 domain-containing protein n=1 Tax=Tumidithrix helvetica TaxID=3457545 RepID=UPI003C82A39C
MAHVRDATYHNQATLYETDFHAWAFEQAKLIQQKRWQELDTLNLMEEIESLGKQQREQLENRLAVLLGHLLKWDLQPQLRTKSWKATIREQRRAVQKLIAKNPSLKPYLPEAISDGYTAGMDLVVRETPLDYKDLPKECPFTIEQIFDSTFPVGIEA